MARKGLFELVFILVMLTLMLPATTHHSAIVTYSAQAQANDLLLLTDQAIADALADGSHSSCSASNSQVQNYVNNLQNDYRAIGNDCNVDVSGSGTNPYSGTAYVTCLKNNGNTTTYVKKGMAFNKTVSATSSGSVCHVTVSDNLYSLSEIQVDYNLSYP